MRLAATIVVLSISTLAAGCATAPSGSSERSGAINNVPSPPPPPMAPPPPVAASSPQNKFGFIEIAGASPDSNESSADQSVAATTGLRYVPPVIVPLPDDREQYDGKEVSPVKLVAVEPLSTFSVDVDTGAYANTRRFLSQGQLPPRDAVRTEELINYFRYDYAKPQDRSVPFSVTTDMAVTPWNPDTRLMRIGLRGYDLPEGQRPPANLVFLMDVSGSMGEADKLPLVKTALSGLAGELSPQDKVSIVVYAGAAGLVLQPTSDAREIRRALDKLNAGGSTAGGAGIELAYQIAEDNFIEGGVNRVIIATDGDFNVGVSNTDKLVEMIKARRDSGITLTTLGFGQYNYNEALMEQMANHGNGNYAYIDSALEAKKVLGDEMSSTLFTIAKDVKIQVEFNPAVISQYRLIGYENRALRNEEFDNDAVDAGDIGAGHQVTAIYEVVPAGGKGWVAPLRYGAASSSTPSPTNPNANTDEVAFIKLRYKMPDGETSKLIDAVVPTSALQFARLPQGDFAFAAAVAAYGQKLRGDALLGSFDFSDIGALAGSKGDYWRQEFRQLAEIADGLTDQSGG